MNERITVFLQKQTCCTICCTDDAGHPYCFSCYYSFNPDRGLLYFKSSAEAHHSFLLKQRFHVAGTVLPDKLNKLVTKGIQFQGVLLKQDHSLAKDAFVNFHKQYPLAMGFSGDVFVIQINQIKMTDNNLGFGKKTTWNRFETGNDYLVENK